MSRMPQMDGRTVTQVYDEHEFALDVTFGASSTVTGYGRDCSLAKTTTTTFTVTLPKPYARFSGPIDQFWIKPTGADPLLFTITTDNLATAGTFVLTSVSMNSAGTATAPASGDRVLLRVLVSDNPLNTKAAF